MRNTAVEVIKKIRNAGFEAYWAGGCVRDLLLHIEPKDYDIVTSAKPEQIKKLLKNTLEVGKAFGVMVVKTGRFHFEVATFRSEGLYKDRRRPDKVFWTNAQEDAKRRDFTINGLFYDPIAKKVIDYVSGQADIKNKVVRFIGNPDERIKEDHLRLLRAIRFKNTLSFKYDKRTYEALKNNSYLIESVSKERIKEELDKMFTDINRADALTDLSKTGLLKYVLPEIEKAKGIPQPDEFHKEGDVYLHTLYAIESLPPKSPVTLIWAVLLHDSGKPATLSFPKSKTDRIRFNKHSKYSAGIASKVCRRLKFPNIERELIVWLVKNHLILVDIPKMNIPKQRRWLMDNRFPWLLEVAKADASGMQPQDLSIFKKNLKLYNDAKKLYQEELKKPKFKPLITGADLIYHLKLDPGPQIGKLLKMIEDTQLEGKIKTKEQALSLARTISQ